MAKGLRADSDGITTRQIAQPATGPAPDSSSPTGTVPLASVTNADDLKAIEALSATTGLLAKTAANAWALRTLTLSAALDAILGITNPAGVAGDPQFTIDNQNANLVLAGPTSGGAAVPAFRALVAGDLPASGAWTTPAFSAGDFTANGTMTWTVEAGDVLAYAYRVDGKTMHLEFNIVTTTVGGTLSDELRIAIPNGHTAAKTTRFVYNAENDGTDARISKAFINGGAAYIILKYDVAGNNWVAGTNVHRVSGHVTFEIE